MTSSFLSSVPLAGHVRKSDTPGVGEYDPNQIESKVNTEKGSYMFAAGGKGRGGVASTATGEHVGPGSYELEGNSLYQKMIRTTNTRLPGFGSSSVRQGPEA